MIFPLFFFYLGVISVISIIVTVHDKQSAVHHARRVPEKHLILLSLLGGSVAMYLTMQLIRHKTRHAKFMLGIPAIIVAQLAFLIAVSRRFA